MNSMPLVSVILAVYNGEQHLAPAIDSVLKQSYPHFELVIVDDGSTDATANIVNGYQDARVRYYHQQNKGQAAARNFGMLMATGQLFAFIDADDLWLSHKLKLQVAAMQNNPQLAMVFGHVQQFFSPELSSEFRKKINCPQDPQPGYSQGTLLISQKAFFQVGLFNTELRAGEFIDWYIKATEQNLQSMLLNEIVMQRRIHANNMGILQRANYQDYPRLLKEALDRRRQVKPVADPALVTVIIAVYNGEQFLAKAIDSVLRQSYQRIQLIVIDDGSVDTSASIAAAYAADGALEFIQLAQNQGVAAARNQGLLQARGDFITFLDADDTMFSERVAAQVNYLLHHPQAAGVLIKQEIVVETNVTPPEWLQSNPQLMVDGGCPPASVMVRRKDMLAVGYFDSNFQTGEDTQWLARFEQAGKPIAELQQTLMQRRMHGANLTYQLNSKVHSNLLRIARGLVKTATVRAVATKE